MPEKDNSSKRILLDCSYISMVDRDSGIQRVVRNILKESKRVKNPPGWSVHFVVWRNGQFYEVDSPNHPPSRISSNHHHLKTGIVRSLKMILPSAIYSFLKNVWTYARPYLKNPVQDSTPMLNLGSAINFSSRDILVLLDSSWQVPYWREVFEAKSAGAKVGMVAYDLIPVHLPQYCDLGVVISFNSWLPKAIQWSDFCLAISEATANAVRDYAKTKLAISGLKTEKFMMAADLDRKKGGKVRSTIKKTLEDTRPIYISVGTIEPRKNQEFLLDVFEKLWDKGEDVRLILIGREGWHTEKLIMRIKSHSEYGKRLHLLTDLNDTELELAYKLAKALLIPSLEEGYGLPIIEVLNHGKPVFASDIPVFHEVGGSYCEYFSLASIEDLVSKLDKFEKTSKFPAKVPLKSLKWPSWGDSTRDFIRKTIELSH